MQTGVYSAEFGREASQVNVVTKSGTQQPCTARSSSSTATTRSMRGRTRSTPSRRRRRRRRSSGISTATRPAARCGATSSSSCRTSRATRTTSSSRRSTACRRRRCGAATSRSCSANLGAINPQTGQPAGVIVDPTQCTVVGTTRTCLPFAGNIIPAARLDATSKQLLEFYPEPNNGTGGLTNNYLVVPGSRDRQEPVHAADGLRSELRLDLDGTLQLRQRERSVPGAQVERHQAENERASGRDRATPGRYRRRPSTSSGSASTTSSTRSDASWRSNATW